jgi:hypothetical protein
MVDWELHGSEFGNCNCDYACPCQFNALPSEGYCQAIVFVKIDQGHFGEAKLDGLNLAFAVAWPGPVHEGHGRYQPIIDERANDAQREGILSIMTGKETDPFTTFWFVYTAMCETILPPVYTRIAIDADMKARKATCSADGIALGRGQPILNPVTGAEHTVGIVLPDGFEYGQNQVGRGWSTSTGEVALVLEDSYAQWCELHFNQHGRIH